MASRKIVSMYIDFLMYNAKTCTKAASPFGGFSELKSVIKPVEGYPLEEVFMHQVIMYARKVFSKAFLDWSTEYERTIEQETNLSLNLALRDLTPAVRDYDCQERFDFMALLIADFRFKIILESKGLKYNTIDTAFVKPLSYETLMGLKLYTEEEGNAKDDSLSAINKAVSTIYEATKKFYALIESSEEAAAREEAFKEARRKAQEELRLIREAESREEEERRQAAIEEARRKHMEKITAPTKNKLTRKERMAIHAAEKAAKLLKAKTRG